MVSGPFRTPGTGLVLSRYSGRDRWAGPTRMIVNALMDRAGPRSIPSVGARHTGKESPRVAIDRAKLTAALGLDAHSSWDQIDGSMVAEGFTAPRGVAELVDAAVADHRIPPGRRWEWRRTLMRDPSASTTLAALTPVPPLVSEADDLYNALYGPRPPDRRAEDIYRALYPRG